MVRPKENAGAVSAPVQRTQHRFWFFVPKIPLQWRAGAFGCKSKSLKTKKQKNLQNLGLLNLSECLLTTPPLTKKKNCKTPWALLSHTTQKIKN